MKISSRENIIVSFWNIPNFVKIINSFQVNCMPGVEIVDLNSFCYVQMDLCTEGQPSIRKSTFFPFSLSSLFVCVEWEKMDAVCFPMVTGILEVFEEVCTLDIEHVIWP